jgi:hypothetical protein
MNVLILQIVLAVATMLMLFMQWQLCCRHHRGPERRVVPVRREQRPPVPYVSRVRLPHRGRIVATRTVALSTLPMPIKGTVEPAEPVQLVRADVAASPLLPSDIRFATPDVALMRRVVEGLRALPASPRDTPPVTGA